MDGTGYGDGCAAAIAAFSDDVRDSTLKRLRLVRSEDRTWSCRPDLLCFADVLQHLVDADRWLFDLLDGNAAREAVISPGDADLGRWDVLLDALGGLGRERSQRIIAVPAGEWDARRFDLGRRGTVSLAQLILRCNLDHEIHHRGALQLALRLRYGTVVPA